MDYTLEREVADLMRCSEDHAAGMTRVLEDHVHVYIPQGIRRGHSSRLSTEDEAQQPRARLGDGDGGIDAEGDEHGEGEVRERAEDDKDMAGRKRSKGGENNRREA